MLVKQRKINLLIIPAMLIFISGCREVDVPKPRGYFRIALPEKKYIPLNTKVAKNNDLPLSFEYPAYGHLSFQQENGGQAGWFNIEFPAYKAKIYLTYKNIKNNFGGLMEQTYKMNVKNHIEKADAINEKEFNNSKKRVFGVLYDLKGNTATAVQFYATDSTKHYLRGSLYFSVEPDADSLAPVINFFRADIIHIIETLKWKK
jgi:gliding motility-associated lipoprotein GldD